VPAQNGQAALSRHALCVIEQSGLAHARFADEETRLAISEDSLKPPLLVGASHESRLQGHLPSRIMGNLAHFTVSLLPHDRNSLD
jgi:hypothetical protein